MSGKMQLTARLDQRMVMSQQLRQAITLLQYNTLDLKQLVQQFVDTNPLIEVEEAVNDDESDVPNTHFLEYSAEVVRSNYSHENESYLENRAIPKSLRGHLLEQTLLCHFDDEEQAIAEAMVDAIDHDGYLTMSLEDIQETFVNRPDMALLRSVLSQLRMFDPAGVGAFSLQECLILQLERLSPRTEAWHIANDILHDGFELLSNNQSKKILKHLNISLEKFNEAMSLIRTLNPHPGLEFADDSENLVEPELYVKKVKNTWEVCLVNSILTSVKINKQYQAILKQNKKHSSYEALSRELQEAKWLLSGLKRRNETLLRVASYIIEAQKNFLEQGPESMKPMNIIDVSTALDLHESTVSRLTTGKHIITPRGVFELKYFFPSHVTTKGGDMCSDTAVKALIKEIIGHESGSHHFSDGEIAAMLQEKGINIARRTVAKYRESMQILSSYQRS